MNVAREWIGGLVFGLTLGLGVGAVAAREADDRPSFVFAIADDWSFPHAGAYGSDLARTPAFDRLAREGVLFTRAFCASPSCTPSRGAILTGQAVHRLGPGGNLWSRLPAEYATYPDLLERAGYAVGLTGKGWGPGTTEGTGRDRNPAGPNFRDFDAFLKTVPEGAPFCYWYGSHDPHRPYEEGSGVAAGKDPDTVKVPPFLPDESVVRRDLLDYAVEVERFDAQVGRIIAALEAAGRADNTIVIMTSDNGMPFPRAKANLYDAGTRMPMAVRWPSKVKPGRTVDAFVSLTDVAPTFLEAAGLTPPDAMTGRSLLDLLSGADEGRDRDHVFVERERHANVRAGDLGYPSRAIRTGRYLYIRNLRPDRWPAGDPVKHVAVGPFGDIDGSPTKALLLGRRDDPEITPFFALACGKRPAEELYDVAADPGQVRNLAGLPEHAGALADLRARLEDWMRRTGDPRVDPADDSFDRYPYVGTPGR